MRLERGSHLDQLLNRLHRGLYRETTGPLRADVVEPSKGF